MNAIEAVPTNISLRDAYRMVDQLGGTVRPVNRTGEYMVTIRSVQDKPVVVNNRRHDANRKIVTLLRKDWVAQHGGGA